MFLIRLHVHNFRCIADLDFGAAPGINVIHGENAQGKTSVLEAILFAATSKSHRTNTEDDLVRHRAPGFNIRIEAMRAGQPLKIEAFWLQGAKRFRINGIPQTRLSDLLGRLNVVFFCPEDIELVKGGAAVRRLFLDMELSQIDPGYLAALQHYRQALRQRNELLRAPVPDPALIAPWDVQLARHGAILIERRARFIADLSTHASSAYAMIARGEALTIAYQPDIANPAGLLEALTKALTTDIKRRVTSAGPHRDDIDIQVADRPARSHASQGQQKSAALAIKLAEVHLVHERTGEYPVLMLDEVLAELDEHRAGLLFQAIPPEVQCLVTTTAPMEKLPELGRGAQHYRIHGGHLET